MWLFFYFYFDIFQNSKRENEKKKKGFSDGKKGFEKCVISKLSLLCYLKMMFYITFL